MKSLLNVAKYLLLLGIGVFLFWYVYRDFDYQKLWIDIQHLNYGYVALGFVILTVSNISRAMRWNLMIKPLGYDVSVRNSFLAITSGYFVNLFLPRVGEVSRCVALNRTNKVPVDKLIGTVVVERIVDMLVLLVLLGIALVVEFQKLKGFFTDSIGRLFNGKAGQAGSSFPTSWIVVALLVLVFMALLGVFVYKRFKGHALLVKIRGMVSGFADGIRSITRMQNRGQFIFHSIFIWLMYFVMTYVMFKALNVTADLGWNVALAVLVMSTFGFVVPVQGGAGTYDFAVIQTLLLYGLTSNAAETYAFVSHAFQTLVWLVSGSICMMYLAVAFRKSKANLHEVPQPDQAEAI